MIIHRIRPIGQSAPRLIYFWHVAYNGQCGLTQSLLARRLRRENVTRIYLPIIGPYNSDMLLKRPASGLIEPVERFWPSDRVEESVSETVDGTVVVRIESLVGNVVDHWG